MNAFLKKGFTLVELMVGTGIASALVLIIAGALKQSGSINSDLKRTGEVNGLVQFVTSELSRKEVCEKNFVPAPGLGVTTANGSLASIKNKSGSNIIQTGSPYGEYISNIVGIDYTFTTATALAPNASLINLTVTYAPKPKNGVAQPNKNFVIPLNVFLNSAGTRVETCFSDVQSLMKNAVRDACKGNGAKWYPYNAGAPAYPYGHCEHQVELVDGSAIPAVIAPNGAGDALCPAGELLRLVDTSNNKMTFQCSKLTTIDPDGAGAAVAECDSWSYMKGIKADGSVDCQDMRTLFDGSTGTGVIVARTAGASVTYHAQPIICPADKILVAINADGSLVCMNPRQRQTCNPGEYLTINVSLGQPTCVPVTNNTTCPSVLYPGKRFIRSITAAGDVVCADTVVPGGPCPANQVATGIDAAGAIKCDWLLP